MMIEFFDALKIINHEPVLSVPEKCELKNSLGRILAEDVLSDTDMPPFNKSAMDGFACKRTGLGETLKVIETIKAGDIPQKSVGINECSRIMTGARVPEGADCVVMVEHTENTDAGHIRFTGSKTDDNIAYKGEDIKKGDISLSGGCVIKPQHIAVLASSGCTSPMVYRRPRVAVLSTGDELVEPDEMPAGTNIRNSNGPQLTAQALAMGAEVDYLGIVKDTPVATHTAVKHAVDGYDVVLITGGVSMGDFDYVPMVLKETGVKLFFEKVAVKPGRPTVFGRKGDTFVFGLPGNPVSSFTIFELMVKPLIFRLMGHMYNPQELRLPIGTNYERKKADRISWTPVYISSDGMVMPESYHGSAHIHSLSGAVGLMAMDTGIFSYKKGDIVNVRQI